MRASRHLSVAILPVAAALALAACGGGSSPGVANLASSTSTTPSAASGAGGTPTAAQLLQEQRDAVRFADCMRTHGISSFPDPTVAPRAFKEAFSNQSATFRSAYAACGHLLPAGRSANGGTTQTQRQTVALLAFARCLRRHGFPSFPDPTNGGQLSREMLARAGIDIHEPALLEAADACAAVTHGVITRAVIARFVAGH